MAKTNPLKRYRIELHSEEGRFKGAAEFSVTGWTEDQVLDEAERMIRSVATPSSGDTLEIVKETELA